MVICAVSSNRARLRAGDAHDVFGEVPAPLMIFSEFQFVVRGARDNLWALEVLRQTQRRNVHRERWTSRCSGKGWFIRRHRVEYIKTSFYLLASDAAAENERAANEQRQHAPVNEAGGRSVRGLQQW
jgi:hypothetical protein